MHSHECLLMSIEFIKWRAGVMVSLLGFIHSIHTVNG